MYLKKTLFSFLLIIGVVGVQASENDCKDQIFKLLEHLSLCNDIEMQRLSRLLSQYPQVAQDVEILNKAVWCVAESVIELLLQHGADPNKPDTKKRTAMIISTRNAVAGSYETMKPMIKLLMQHGGNVDQPYTTRATDRWFITLSEKTPRDNASKLIAEIEAEIAQEQLESKALAALITELGLRRSKKVEITAYIARALDNPQLLKK